MFGYKLPPIEDVVSGRWGNSKKVIDETCRRAQEKRSLHRFARNGFWKGDKSREFQTVAKIPAKIFLHPEFRERYWNAGADHKQKWKSILEFLKVHPEFNVTDTPVSRL